jgi:hypothetical protein
MERMRTSTQMLIDARTDRDVGVAALIVTEGAQPATAYHLEVAACPFIVHNCSPVLASDDDAFRRRDDGCDLGGAYADVLLCMLKA